MRVAFDGIVHCDEDGQTFQVRPFFRHGTGLTGFEVGAEMEGASLARGAFHANPAPMA
jgi:hypothetical protein